MNKIAFITGISGMDSSHLAEFLLEKSYKVFGLLRRSSTDNTWRIRKILDKIEIINGDLGDQSSLDKAINIVKPDECYHLGAQSFVQHSFEAPEYTINVTGLGTLRLLEAIKNHKKDCKIFFAGSSEQFGKVQESPQTETTSFYPRSPYGIAKVMGFNICRNYRESYNMFISNAISFNHCSHRRGLEFVERKISYGVAKIYLKMADCIELGNLDSKRDWGWAPEYCEYFWKMLQLDKPDDFVLATGETHSIREFLETAFESVEIYNWQDYVKQNPKYMRPAEVDYLLGDARKAKEILGWEHKTSFKELINIMVDADLTRLRRGDRYE